LDAPDANHRPFNPAEIMSDDRFDGSNVGPRQGGTYELSRRTVSLKFKADRGRDQERRRPTKSRVSIGFGGESKCAKWTQHHDLSSPTTLQAPFVDRG
jgi:hypothetical protein